ncbi:unnamed protein product, partial [Prorocentrum cordatum]
MARRLRDAADAVGYATSSNCEKFEATLAASDEFLEGEAARASERSINERETLRAIEQGVTEVSDACLMLSAMKGSTAQAREWKDSLGSVIAGVDWQSSGLEQEAARQSLLRVVQSSPPEPATRRSVLTDYRRGKGAVAARFLAGELAKEFNAIGDDLGIYRDNFDATVRQPRGYETELADASELARRRAALPAAIRRRVQFMQARAERQMPGTPMAWLHVYDLLPAGANDLSLHVGLGLFHVGVEVFGVEWSYGLTDPDPSLPPVTGVYPVEPTMRTPSRHRERIWLGPVRMKGAREVWSLLGSLACKWLGREYHPFRHNCIHFCAELCECLGVQDRVTNIQHAALRELRQGSPTTPSQAYREELPSWVGRVADAAGCVLAPLLDALDISLVPPGGNQPNSPFWRADEGSAAEASATPPSLVPPGRASAGDAQAAAPERPAAGPPRCLLSVPLAVSLDFEEKFGWSMLTMLLHEMHGSRVRNRAASALRDHAARGAAPPPAAQPRASERATPSPSGSAGRG